MTNPDRPPLRVVDPDEAPPAPRKRKRKGLGDLATSARRKRARATKPDDAARMLLGAANVAAGALDLFGRMASGEPFLVAAKKAVRGAKKRGAAIEGATAPVCGRCGSPVDEDDDCPRCYPR